MALGDICKVVINSQWQDQAGVNVLHYVQTSNNVQELTANTLKSLADAVSGSVGQAIKETMSQSAEYIGAAAYYPFRGDLGVGQLMATSILGAGPGGGNEEVAPTQISGLVAKKTAFTGRRGRGRVYVPFPPLAAVTGTDDLVSAAYRTLLLDVAVALVEPKTFTQGGGTWTFTPCLIDQNGGLVQPARQLTTAVARVGWATQRRRSYYGRRNVPFVP